ncbi:hypothetical protein [Loktanella sp. SALINAS62]|uniref:hypothetical protein n=1 Tax=Loktanella sp. SALINAS62 TaxID=2706124 RepID=UPI001B8CB23C|nr:hypothetical protein [Loktanella sp. SALINAS62]MBS1302700.1 hypothetical protein [Loktanella sp. SALINAS62]
MMNMQKLVVSAIAICAAAPAMAFDTVTWNWNADVISSVTTNAVSDVVVAPTGLEQVEVDQTSLGDFASTSSSLGITNDVVSLSGLTLDDVLAVETSSTVLGNSAALEADVSTQYDAIQTFGGVDPLLGTLDVSLPGTLTASSTTIGVINGTVDSDATSLANNFTADLVTTSGSDAFLVGNNVQTAYAVGTSTSLVDLVSFTDVTGLGTLVDPAVSSVATSIGNNIGVTIDGIN